MKSPVRPELPTASVGSSQVPTAALDNSALSAIRPESTYKSGKVVQTSGATSFPTPSSSAGILNVHKSMLGKTIFRHWLKVRLFAMIAVAAALLIASWLEASRLGMAEALPYHSFARAFMSIGVSISKLTYGADGYLLYTPVVTALTESGFRGDRIAIPGAINHAIDGARSLKLERGRIPAEQDWGDDKGYSDFTTLAFRLFGFRIEALFDLYFLLLGIATAAFALRFYDDRQPMLVLIAFLAAHLLVVRILPNSAVTSVVHDARFLPAISCISMLHWMLAAVRPPRRTVFEVLLLVAQATLLVLVLDSRSSAIWQILAIAFTILASWLLASRLGGPQRLRWAAMAGGILLAGVVALNTYKAIAYDIRYQTSGTQAHAVWHNVYMGLGFHPEAIRKYDLLPDDSTVYQHTFKYLSTNLEAVNRLGIAGIELYEPVFKPLGWGGYDKAVKDMFFDFVRRDPLYVAETFLIYKPLYLLEEIAWQMGLKREFPIWIEMTSGHRPMGDRRLDFLSPVVILAILLAFLGNIGTLGRKEIIATLVAVALGALFSLIPSFVVGPFYYDLPVVFILFAMLAIVAVMAITDTALCLVLGGRYRAPVM